MLIPVINPGMIMKRPEYWIGSLKDDLDLDLDMLQLIEASGERYVFFKHRDDVKVGMEVTIVRPREDYSDHWENTWAHEMHEYIGRSGIVTNVSRSGLFIPGLTSCYHWPWQACVLKNKQGAFPFYYDDSREGLPTAIKELDVVALDPLLLDSDEFLFVDGKAIEKKKTPPQQKDEADLLAEFSSYATSPSPWRVYQDDLREVRSSALTHDDVMDVARFNALYQTDFNRITDHLSQGGLSSNARATLRQQVQRYTSENTRRQMDMALREMGARQFDVERRYRVPIMEPLQFNEATTIANQERFRSCEPAFQVVFNGRDIVRVVD